MNSIKFPPILNENPTAIAIVRGSPEFHDIYGEVRFYQTTLGVIVEAQVSGLPTSDNICAQPIFAFHIHNGTSCGGVSGDYFSHTMVHYNPHACPHPYHAGDMPPLFGGANGYAFLSFFSDRFKINDVLGKTVVIHASPDDFTTQPSGRPGTRMACGVIETVEAIEPTEPAEEYKRCFKSIFFYFISLLLCFLYFF
ncbi:MAG: superoxide dismutase family protein [Monoglobales bacterium]